MYAQVWVSDVALGQYGESAQDVLNRLSRALDGWYQPEDHEVKEMD